MFQFIIKTNVYNHSRSLFWRLDWRFNEYIIIVLLLLIILEMHKEVCTLLDTHPSTHQLPDTLQHGCTAFALVLPQCRALLRHQMGPTVLLTGTKSPDMLWCVVKFSKVQCSSLCSCKLLHFCTHTLQQGINSYALNSALQATCSFLQLANTLYDTPSLHINSWSNPVIGNFLGVLLRSLRSVASALTSYL